MFARRFPFCPGGGEFALAPVSGTRERDAQAGTGNPGLSALWRGRSGVRRSVGCVGRLYRDGTRVSATVPESRTSAEGVGQFLRTMNGTFYHLRRLRRHVFPQSRTVAHPPARKACKCCWRRFGRLPEASIAALRSYSAGAQRRENPCSGPNSLPSDPSAEVVFL